MPVLEDNAQPAFLLSVSAKVLATHPSLAHRARQNVLAGLQLASESIHAAVSFSPPVSPPGSHAGGEAAFLDAEEDLALVVIPSRQSSLHITSTSISTSTSIFIPTSTSAPPLANSRPAGQTRRRAHQFRTPHLFIPPVDDKNERVLRIHPVDWGQVSPAGLLRGDQVDARRLDVGHEMKQTLKNNSYFSDVISISATSRSHAYVIPSRQGQGQFRLTATRYPLPLADTLAVAHFISLHTTTTMADIGSLEFPPVTKVLLISAAAVTLYVC
jgi:hypothetical protein